MTLAGSGAYSPMVCDCEWKMYDQPIFYLLTKQTEGCTCGISCLFITGAQSMRIVGSQ